jgi:hypothetical protein
VLVCCQRQRTTQLAYTAWHPACDCRCGSCRTSFLRWLGSAVMSTSRVPEIQGTSGPSFAGLLASGCACVQPKRESKGWLGYLAGQEAWHARLQWWCALLCWGQHAVCWTWCRVPGRPAVAPSVQCVVPPHTRCFSQHCLCWFLHSASSPHHTHTAMSTKHRTQIGSIPRAAGNPMLKCTELTALHATCAHTHACMHHASMSTHVCIHLPLQSGSSAVLAL